MARYVEKQALDDETVALFVRLNAGTASDADLEEMARWAEEDPGKLDALDEVVALWGTLENTAPDPALLTDAPRKPIKKPTELLAGVQHWWASWPLAVGGFAVTMTVIVLLNLPLIAPQDAVIYATTRGEMKQVTLADGSALALNGQTGLDVVFTDRQRLIHMTRGEVFFEVAPDKNIPFIVKVSGAEVRAVGTAFNIDRGEDRLSITVTEGIVDIRLPAYIQHEAQVVRVEAGAQIILPEDHGETYLRHLQQRKLSLDEVTRLLSWREGRVTFDGENLAVVVEKINRMANKQIVIGQESLKTVKIYGSFDLNNAEGFLTSIENLYHIRRSENKDSIYLYPQKE